MTCDGLPGPSLGVVVLFSFCLLSFDAPRGVLLRELALLPASRRVVRGVVALELLGVGILTTPIPHTTKNFVRFCVIHNQLRPRGEAERTLLRAVFVRPGAT